MADRSFPFKSGLHAAGGGVDGVQAAGWIPDRDAGTAGDWFVSDVSGSDDDGDGTRGAPWATLRHALERIRLSGSMAGRTLRIRAEPGGGAYREAISLEGLDGDPGAPFTISGYGAEKPTIKPTRVLRGWTRCDASEATRLGGKFGSVFKTSILTADMKIRGAGTLKPQLGLNLCVDGAPAPLCTDRADPSDAFFQKNIYKFHKATRILNRSGVAAESGDVIATIDHPQVLSKYAEEQLLLAVANIQVAPNFIVTTAISAAAEGRVDIARDGLQYESEKYSLSNILPAITTGHWGFAEETDGTTTIYLWPRDEADLEGGVEISLEPFCVYAEAAHIRLQDLRIVQAGGFGEGQSFILMRDLSGSARMLDGRVFFNLYMGSLGGGVGRPSANAILNERNTLIERVTIENCAGHYGFNINDSQGVRVGYLRAHRVAEDPLRVLRATDGFYCYLRYSEVGMSAHSNLMSLYLGADRSWVHGLVARETRGYMTFQDSAPTHFTMCDIDGNSQPDDSRVLQDQSYGHETGVNYIWNCWFTFARNWMRGESIGLGGEGGMLMFDLRNTILHGGGIQHPSVVQAQSHNIFTTLAWWQGEGEIHYPGLDPTNVIAPALNRVYRNARAGDFRPAPGSPIATKRGAPFAPLIAALESDFPDIDVALVLGRDVLGKSLDPDAPPIGPYAKPRDRLA